VVYCCPKHKFYSNIFSEILPLCDVQIIDYLSSLSQFSNFCMQGFIMPHLVQVGQSNVLVNSNMTVDVTVESVNHLYCDFRAVLQLYKPRSHFRSSYSIRLVQFGA